MSLPSRERGLKSPEEMQRRIERLRRSLRGSVD